LIETNGPDDLDIYRSSVIKVDERVLSFYPSETGQAVGVAELKEAMNYMNLKALSRHISGDWEPKEGCIRVVVFRGNSGLDTFESRVRRDGWIFKSRDTAQLFISEVDLLDLNI